MKKIMIISISVLILSLLFSGCSENNSDDQKAVFSKFLGTWTGDTSSNYKNWTFYNNGSIRLIWDAGAVDYHYWGKFCIERDILDIDAMPVLSMRYTYEFSSNNEILTLTSIYGGDQKILNKIE